MSKGKTKKDILSSKKTTYLNTLLIFVIISILLFPYLTTVLKRFQPKSLSTTQSSQLARDSKDISIPFIDEDWQLPAKNRFYSIRCTKTSEIKSSDKCYLTISRFLHPDTERVLSTIEFVPYGGDQKPSEPNYVSILGATKDKIVLHVQEYQKGLGSIQKTMFVDTRTGNQEILVDKAGRNTIFNGQIFVDRETDAIIYHNQKSGEHSLVRLDMATRQTSTLIHLASDSAYNSYSVFAKISDSQYLIESNPVMSSSTYFLCQISSEGDCQQSDFPATNLALFSHISISPDKKLVSWVASSGQYFPKSTPDAIYYSPIESSLIVANIDGSNQKVLTSITNDPSSVSLPRTITNNTFSPTGKSVIAAIGNKSHPRTISGKLKGWVVNDQGITSQELSFINKINTINSEPSTTFFSNLPTMSWVKFINDDGNIELGFIVDMYHYNGSGLPHPETSLIFVTDPYNSKNVSTLNSTSKGYDSMHPGANTPLGYLFDPVDPSGVYYLKPNH